MDSIPELNNHLYLDPLCISKHLDPLVMEHFIRLGKLGFNIEARIVSKSNRKSEINRFSNAHYVENVYLVPDSKKEYFTFRILIDIMATKEWHVINVTSILHKPSNQHNIYCSEPRHYFKKSLPITVID
jgi:hypothetical protein